jgi:hypothetical protein
MREAFLERLMDRWTDRRLEHKEITGIRERWSIINSNSEVVPVTATATGTGMAVLIYNHNRKYNNINSSKSTLLHNISRSNNSSSQLHRQ